MTPTGERNTTVAHRSGSHGFHIPSPAHDAARGDNVPDAREQRTNWRQGLPTLSGDGLLLREPTLADASNLADLVARDIVGCFTHRLPVSTSGWVQQIQCLRADRSAGLSVCYVATDERTSEVAGLILVRRLEREFHIAQCEFLFGAASWLSDLPTTSLEYVLDFAFRDIGLHRLECRSLTATEEGLLRSLGFAAEGLLRAACQRKQGAADQTIWSLLRVDCQSNPLLPPHRGPVCRQSAESEVATTDAEELQPLPTWSTELPALSGPRVTLREIESADGEALLRQLEPADIAVCIEPPPTTGEMFRQYIAWATSQRALGRAVCFSILVDGDQHPAGLLQVRSLDPCFAVAEWGAGLARRFRGTGIFAEVMNLIAPFVFDTLGVHRLEARTSGGNLAAIASLRRLGAVKEACLRQSFLKDGEYYDDELWAVTDVEWRRGRNG